MNCYREDNSPSCYFHPNEIVVGVCPLCLNERLLILAAKRGRGRRHHHRPPSAKETCRDNTNNSRRVTQRTINLPKIFAFGSLLNRLEFRHWISDNSDRDASSISQEDSFISIKFEDNGVASWEKGTVPKVSLEHCSKSWNNNFSKEAHKNNKPAHGIPKETMSVIEQTKPRASMRWQKRIGHIFQLIRWRRSNSKGSVCHVGTKVEGVKVRKKGWIRTLTKRRTEE